MNVRAATAADLPDILRLLEQAQLPTADLVAPSAVDFWVAEGEDAIVGAVGLERHGSAALLRSLVVAPTMRGAGLGVSLVTCAESAARTRGVRQVVLLTQTARDFFLRRGYAVIAREAAPAAVQSSAEFRSLCPASATCMSKTLA